MTEDEKTKAAAEKVDAMIGFYIHAAVYALVNTILLAVNLIVSDSWWVQWPILGWGIGLLGHGLIVLGQMPIALADWRSRKINELRTRLE